MKKRVCVIYSGEVQGVGFRYTVKYIVKSYDIAGYVKNLPDGNVEIVAEGEKSALERFLSNIRKSHLGNYIVNEDIRWQEATGDMSIFQIRF